MKIAQKLILLFLLMALLPILAIGLFSYFNTQKALNREITGQIANVLTSQVNKINAQYYQDEQTVGLFADNGRIQILQSAYANTPSTATAQQLSSLLTSMRQSDQGIRRAYIIGTNGVVVASTDPQFIGKNYRNTKVFQIGLKGVNVSMFFNDINGVEGHYLIAPIVVNGSTTVGVVVLEYEIYSYSFITSNYVGLGATGETFMLGPNGSDKQVNLMPLRFNAKGALEPIFTTGSGSQARNYRHHLVLLKTTSLYNPPWTVGVMIDQNEAYAPVIQLRNLTFGIIIATSILAGLIGWYFAYYITAPIKRFMAVVMRIQRGDLSQRVSIESNDEIGLLGTAFNEMTNSLVESQARLTASISSVPFGFGLIDGHNRMVFSNPLLSKLLGRTIPADPDKTIVVLDQIDADFSHVIKLKALIAESQNRRHEIERNIEYGPLFFRIFLAPIIASDGRVLGTVLIVEDTTEQMALDRSKDEFFSIASHELRTPLTAVRGNSDMILKYYSEQMKDPELKTMVTDIYDASIRLINIVNDFLDMSRLEQGRMVLKNSSFDLTELIAQTLREYDVTSSRRKLKLSVTPAPESLPPVFGDRDRTRQILVNLLGNAIRYTKEGGVTFTLKREKDMIEAQISDTGQGIKIESQHLLFRKFQQASSSILTRDNTRSTGLGLYISKLLCEEMGGKIRLVSSEVDKGTTFAFSLPVATPELIKQSEKEAAQDTAATTKTTLENNTP